MAVQSKRTANINVAVPPEVKEQAEGVFKYLGLNMSSAVNIFLNMCINVNGLPFEVKYPNVNAETQKALEDSENGIGMSGPFDTFEEMMESIHAQA